VGELAHTRAAPRRCKILRRKAASTNNSTTHVPDAPLRYGPPEDDAMMGATPAIQTIYRYPVKGLSPESLARTSLSPGESVPGDRIYAIENGPSGFDAKAPEHLGKMHFLMLMRNSRLAALQTRFNTISHVLTVRLDGNEVARGDLRTPEGRAAIEHFIARYCADELRGPPKVLHAPGHSFADESEKLISIINLASVAATESAIGMPLNPLRFRGNIHVEGWPAWHEFDLVGREISLGSSARLKVIKRIERCAATSVDPDTGVRDVEIPRTLLRAFGSPECGIYAKVVAGGEIAVNDSVTAAQ